MNKADWVWMGHAGHFCGANDCRFRLTTYVGDFIVSTVGEYTPKLFSKNDRDFQPLGCGKDDLYETLVFPAKKDDKGLCCPYIISSFIEIDGDRYKTPLEALEGHMNLCEKFSQKSKKEFEEVITEE